MVPEPFNDPQVVIPTQVGLDCVVIQYLEVGHDDVGHFRGHTGLLMPSANPLQKRFYLHAGEVWRGHFHFGIFNIGITVGHVDHAAIHPDQTFYRLWGFDSHVQSNTATPRVADHHRVINAKTLDDTQGILGHRIYVVALIRFVAQAVTALVNSNHGVVLRQDWSNHIPDMTGGR